MKEENSFKYLDIDDYSKTSFNFFSGYTEETEFKYTSGYTKELASHHAMMSYTLMASNDLFPSLRSAIDYYINHRENMTKYEKVYVFIRLTNDMNNSSFTKIFIDNYFDISTVKEYLTEDEYTFIKTLIMEIKLKH